MDGIILRPRGIGRGGGYPSLVTGQEVGLGPDMAMFANSRADAYRFADWVAADDETLKRRIDRCYIDYRAFEPNWLQVKVVVEEEHEAVLDRLYNAITLRDGWCDEETVKWALDPENHREPTAIRYHRSVVETYLLPDGYHAKMPDGPRHFLPTEEERAAILELSRAADLSPGAVMRQALRLYQTHQHRLAAGETVSWSGDEQRAREFAGPDLA